MADRIQDRELLTLIAGRGEEAHRRLREAISQEKRLREKAAEALVELYDAQREFENSTNQIKTAGFHDTGHILTHLRSTV